MKDILIVGGGPAGMTAAIYALRAGKTVLILEGKQYGGQIVNTPDVENYPGLKHVSGFDYATTLYEQAVSFGAEFAFEQAVSVTDLGDRKEVKTSKGNVYEAKAVILATGAKNRPVGLARETDLIGRGVSYCATCDGMFFRKKDVAVFGGGNTAVSDALFLANYCNRVYLIHRRNAFRASDADVQKLRAKDNVELVLDSVVTELQGDPKLAGIVVKNVQTGEERTIEVSGLFVAIGQMPDNGAFEDVAALDEKGYILATEACRTKTPGVFTAGDCRTKEVRQLATAVSDGAVAGLAAAEYVG